METETLITICIFILGIGFTYWHNKKINREAKVDSVGTELIHICDRLLRAAVSFELNVLELRTQWEILKTLNKEDNLYVIVLADTEFFHRQSERLRENYTSLKGELKKVVKDFNMYWPEDKDKPLMFYAMEKAVFLKMENYTNTGIEGKFTDHNKIRREYTKISKKVQEKILFNGIGIHLIYMQKIIDRKSPTLYVESEDLKKRLNYKLIDYDKAAQAHCYYPK